MPRTCTGEVWVRSRLPPSSQKVSCMSRAGWSAGMFRASKLWYSVFHLGAVEHGEAERAEELFELALDARDGVQVAAARAGRGQREVEPFGVQAGAQGGLGELRLLAGFERPPRSSAWRR